MSMTRAKELQNELTYLLSPSFDAGAGSKKKIEIGAATAMAVGSDKYKMFMETPASYKGFAQNHLSHLMKELPIMVQDPISFVCYNCGKDTKNILGCLTVLLSDRIPQSSDAQFPTMPAVILMCSASCCGLQDCKKTTHSAIVTELAAKKEEYLKKHLLTSCTECGKMPLKNQDVQAGLQASSVDLKRCSGSCGGIVAYCSKNCQRKAWGSHKKVCGKKSSEDEMVDLPALNKVLPYNTMRLIDHGMCIVGGDSHLVDPKFPFRLTMIPGNLNNETFPIRVPFYLNGLDSIGGWESEWSSSKSTYVWTDTMSQLGLMRAVPATKAIVVYWKERDTVAHVPGKCPPEDTIDVLARHYALNEAKGRLVAHLGRNYQGEEWHPKPSETAKSVILKLKEKLMEMQEETQDVFPPSLTTLSEQNETKSRLLSTLVSDMEEISNCQLHSDYQLLNDGKLRIQRFDDIFENLSDQEIIRAFSELVLTTGGPCNMCPFQDIKIKKVMPEDKDYEKNLRLGCSYRIDYGHSYCHSMEQMGMKNMAQGCTPS